MKGRVVYLTGPPASGKTTLAKALVEALAARGTTTLWLDSDDLRPVLTPAPSYSDEEREQFYGAIAHLARLGADGGATVVVSATAHRRRYRDRVRSSVPLFFEVRVECDAKLRLERDPKGLYRKAAAGGIDKLPGVGVPYEPPERPELAIDTGTTSIADATQALLGLVG